MNVWVLSWDESEDGSDPLLRVFENRHAAMHAIEQMAMGHELGPVILDQIFPGGDEVLDGVTIVANSLDGESLVVHLRETKIETIDSVHAPFLN